MSGACALIYQMVWTRELRLVFGASTAASSAVIAIFIAGLGWGGLWFGRRVERSGQPLAFYAALELGIAVLSALTPWLLEGVRWLYWASGGSLSLGIAGSTLLRLVLTTLVLGPPTWLMGGTLPAIARAIETDQDRARRGVALMYGLNTLGAVGGSALSTFVLLERLGSRNCLYVACGLNLAIALIARTVARAEQWQKLQGSGSPLPPTAASDSVSAEPLAPPTLVFASAALVGFAFFLMELVWYRMLGPLLGGSIFTFGLILAVALAGIGLGSAVYAMFFAQRRPSLLGFAISCALEAALIALPYALGDRIALWALLLRPLGGVGFGGMVFGWTLIAIAVVLPAALVSGFQFPMLISLLGSGRKHVGRHVGTAYAANTIGAIVGALAGGFGALPALGALGCWQLAAGALAVWGTGIALYTLLQKQARFASSAVFALALVTLLCFRALGPTAAWRHSPIGAGRVPSTGVDSPNSAMEFLTQQRRSIIWQTDGIESALAISIFDGIGFIVNGKSDGNARSDAATQVMGGLLGAALMPQVKHALVIGLGTGSTAGWLGQVPEIERVDVAEIEPAIKEVARLCANVNRDVLHNPKVHIQRGDARELLAVSRQRYDLIFSEPSNPYRAGVASLYTREFYQAVTERLSDNGLFVQWLQTYDVDSLTLRTVYATLSSVFPQVESWSGMNHDLFLVASAKPLQHDPDQLRARVNSQPFARAMAASWQTEGLEGFLSHFVADDSFARAAAASSDIINTDDRTPVEFGFARNTRGDPRIVAESFASAIRDRGANRPKLRGDPALDWGRIDFEREAFALILGDQPKGAHLTPEYQRRLEMLARWQQADFQSAVGIWAMVRGDVQPIQIERLALAEMFAYQLDPGALEEWLKPIERDQATEAELFRGLALLRVGRRDEALATITRGLIAYRTDPWPIPAQLARVLINLQLKAAEDPTLAQHFLNLLAEPFAVRVNESARERARINIAYQLGAQHPACVELFTGMEPLVSWTDALLDFRSACYAAHGHPLREKAQQDVARFRAQQPEAFSELGDRAEL
ncbi:MAG TPA: fused MFS/spermidine synthase [Polyangiales bacterium]|nr:fused MFS/spermidine synthase [Polyangiales bacterium]